MKRLFSFALITSAMIVLLFNSGCKKDEETVNTKLTDSLTKELNSFINVGSGNIHYTLQVVNGSTASSGRTEQTVLDDIIVITSSNGKTRRDTIKTGGQIAYKGFGSGTVAVSIIKSGYTGVSYIVEFPKDTSKVLYASNIVPMYNLGGTSLGTIRGTLFADFELTTIDSVKNRVPDKTVTASLDVPSLPPFFTKNATILSRAYSDAIFAVKTDANGQFTFDKLPTGGNGVKYALTFESFIADQIQTNKSVKKAYFFINTPPTPPLIKALQITNISPLEYSYNLTF